MVFAFVAVGWKSTKYVPGSVILLLLAYPKNEQENLTPDQLKVLKSIIETEFP
jgi:hypothetical protein